MQAYSLLRAHKAWPVAGGIDSQAAWFVEAVSFLDRERSAWQEREMKRKAAHRG